jgi:hypothetical protein
LVICAPSVKDESFASCLCHFVRRGTVDICQNLVIRLQPGVYRQAASALQQGASSYELSKTDICGPMTAIPSSAVRQRTGMFDIAFPARSLAERHSDTGGARFGIGF